MRGFLRVLFRGVVWGLVIVAAIVSILGTIGFIYDIKRAKDRGFETEAETKPIIETEKRTVETHAPAPAIDRKQSTNTYKPKPTISSDTVLYDGDYATITYQGLVLDKDWIPNVGSMQVKIENKCDYEITVTFGEVAINGESYTVHSFNGSCGANSRKTVNYRSLGEPEIPYYSSVTKLSTTITIISNDYEILEYNYPITLDAETDSNGKQQ